MISGEMEMVDCVDCPGDVVMLEYELSECGCRVLRLCCGPLAARRRCVCWYPSTPACACGVKSARLSRLPRALSRSSRAGTGSSKISSTVIPVFGSLGCWVTTVERRCK